MPNRELKKDIENGRGTQQGKGFIAELTYRKKNIRSRRRICCVSYRTNTM
uniref:Uncharacterized protein n=1 Tax=Anguilla anguilla TaxID=7936 RepID=A0A0E9WZE4_ANGAN